MKVLLVCTALQHGGVGKMLNYVASILCEHGFDVSVLSLRHEARPSFLPDKANYYTLKDERLKIGMLWRFEEILNLRLFAKKIRPYVICTFGSEPSVMVRIASLRMKGVTVISAERSDPYTLPWIWKKLSSWAYRNSDYCVFQLEKQRDFYDKRVIMKSIVIPNAFIPRENIGLNGEKRKVIVSAGRFVYQKGYDILIRAFVKVQERHPDYILELYGGGVEQSLYEGLIEDNKLKGKVKLFDYSNDIASIIANCSVFVLSSRFEGIPNVLIEAMAVGVPTVSTDCTPGGPAFLTDNGKRGLLVAVDDVDSMANAISRIIENPDLRNQLSLRGKEICDILNQETITKKWLNFFNNI